MVKKIIVVLVAAVILVTGYISLRKLSYWERSTAIFKFNSFSQSFEGRGGRGFGEQEGGREAGMRPAFREGGERSGRMNIPDSVRKRFQENGQRNFRRNFNRTDSAGFNRMRRDTVFMGRGEFEGRIRGPEGFEGRGDRRGKTISLGRVIYYLGVFAFFTVLMIYFEKAYRLIFKRKNKVIENSDLII